MVCVCFYILFTLPALLVVRHMLCTKKSILFQFSFLCMFSFKFLLLLHVIPMHLSVIYSENKQLCHNLHNLDKGRNVEDQQA